MIISGGLGDETTIKVSWSLRLREGPWWARAHVPPGGGRRWRWWRRSAVLASASAAVVIVAGALAPAAVAKGVQPRFDLTDLDGGPFPSDRFTVSDSSQLTGLRVDLPRPNCTKRPSDCDDVDVLNQLDGFNLQPRLSIPFTGPIDPDTVWDPETRSSRNVFLCKLSDCPRGGFIGVNQVVWDPDPDQNTLHVESDQFLDQDARYLLVVTDGVRDTAGDPIGSAQFRKFLNSGQPMDPAEETYRADLLEALEDLEAGGVSTGHVAAASLFTTESATAVMEKIRDQLEAATPAPAEFPLGSTGERTGVRTVFPFADVASIDWRRQRTTAPDTFQTVPGGIPLGADGLSAVTDESGRSPVGTIAFGRYSSPDYLTPAGVIPPVGTRTGTPAVQGTNEVYFNLFLPSGDEPPGGWPVVIGGHGSGGGAKNTGGVPVAIAAKLAQHGLATIAINAVGMGFGPLGTLTVTNKDASTVTLPDGGRGVDRNGNRVFDHPAGSIPEGIYTKPGGPQAIVFTRDGLRQTDADLMQLARVIEVGMDVDGDSDRDLDASQIYYLGNSLGGMFGTGFAALEPDVGASVLGAAAGPMVEIARLNAVGPFRGLLGQLLFSREPALVNLDPKTETDPINPTNPHPFREDLPLRWDDPELNPVPGAIAIQEEIERFEWAGQSGDPVAYAPHLGKDPLAGVPARPVLFAFARGDPVLSNITTATLLRAGGLADRTTYFRALDAGVTGAANIHEFLVNLTPNPPNTVSKGFALATQEAVARFLASDRHETVDPDGTGPLFETPIAGPLPGEP